MITKALLTVLLISIGTAVGAATFFQQFTLQGSSGTFTAAALTMVNGPPNIPSAAIGSCDIGHCTWIQAQVNGLPVSDVYADLTPMSANYTGNCPGTAFTINDTTHFSVSCTFDGTRNVGHITTAQALTAGDYPITVTATGASGSNTVNAMVHAASCASSPTPGGTDNIPTISGVVCLGVGTYNVTHGVNTVNGGILLGRRGQSVIDGTGDTTEWFLDGYDFNIINVLVNGVTFQNGHNYAWLMAPFTGWVVTNNTINNAINTAVSPGGLVANNIISNAGFSAISLGLNTINIIGNEITGSNQGHFDIFSGLGAIEVDSGQSPTLFIRNNYIHDNLDQSITWSGGSNAPVTITGNTVKNGAGGFMALTSVGPYDVGFNVFANNTIANSNTTCFGTNCPSNLLADALSRSSSQVRIHDNNVLTAASGPAGPNYGIRGIGEVGAGNIHNTVFDHNTQTFADDTGRYGVSSDPSVDAGIGTCASGSENATSPTCSNDNTFYVQNGNTGAAHWFWTNATTNPTPLTWSNYRSSTGQDANSNGGSGGLPLTGTAGIASGCTHVACSGAGVGAGGVPQ